MKKSLFVVILTTVLLLLSFSLMGINKAQSKTIEWRFNYSMPALIPPSNGWEWFGKELEKRSGGRVKITYFPHSTLFHIRAAVENVMAGTAEFSNFSIRTHAKRFPLISVSMLPSVTFPSNPQGTFAASMALKTLYDEFPEIRAEFKDIKLLWINMLAPYHIFSKRPIRVPEDLKGLKVGTGGIQRKLVAGAGGSSVAIIPPKAYMSLKTGVVDAMVMGWGAVHAYKIWEVAGYYTDFTVGRVPLPVIMNLDAWNSAPPDIKKLIEELSVEQLKVGSEGLHESERKGRAEAAKHGMKPVKTSAADRARWAAAISPLEKAWLAQMEAAHQTVAPKVLKRFKELAEEASR